MNRFTLLLVSLVFSSCGPSHDEKAKAPAPSHIPGIQQRIFDKKASETELYLRGGNDIQKNEKQIDFYKWMNGYFKDSLKGNINGFYVTLDQIRIGKLPNTYYLFVDFTTEDRLHFKVEEDLPSSEEQKATPLYKMMKRANEKQKLHLFAHFVKLEDPDAIEQDPTSLNYPTVSILVDSVKN